MKYIEKSAIFCAALISAMPWGAPAETKVERSPLEIGSYIDVGQVVDGAVDEKGNNPDGQMRYLQHTAVYLNQTTTINDRLDVKVGVGGLFFYGYPYSGAAPSRVIKFGPGVGQAQGIYKFGDLQAPSWIVQFGFFPYKYNPDAKNLGEYLMRSGTYPGYEVTGGWSTINSALYMASGLRVRGNFLDGKLGADLNFFIERDIEPQHDLSPSLVLSYKPVPMLEVGAGVEAAHLFAVFPSKIKSISYGYMGDSAYYTDPGDPTASRWTFQGTKVMGRASVNFGSLLNNPWIGKEGLKLYAEAAILGVKDYPYYYDDIAKRIPVMVGLNLPTLNFFDVIAFEYEHRDWNFQNHIGSVIDGEPIWGSQDQVPGGTYDPKHPPEPVRAQGTKWSFYAKKELMKGVSLYTQVASDYLRGIDYQLYFFSNETITARPSQWYYLFRLEFGI